MFTVLTTLALGGLIGFGNLHIGQFYYRHRSVDVFVILPTMCTTCSCECYVVCLSLVGVTVSSILYNTCSSFEQLYDCDAHRH